MSKKIIIIDDEPHIRMLLEQTLEEFEDHGVEIFTAPNGKEGLDLIAREKPQMVFCDVMMPVMNGFEVVAQVRANYAEPRIFFVLLTAKGQEADRQQGLAAGADMYMTKPFDPDLVIEKASEVLGISLS